ncbi:MAG: glycoside hydrolase family 2 protein [Acutalibacteraceae bacterium]
MTQRNPREAFPDPQKRRENWMTLNGEWDFCVDAGDSGEQRGLPTGEACAGGGFDRVITVPFAPESPLSGIGERDFMAAVWYRREITLTKEQCRGVLLLTFGAVDYRATLWVNGISAGEHRGGSTPFQTDIRPFVHEGKNVLVLRARDDTRSGKQPLGKQSAQFASSGCCYTRTTGIWQPVTLQIIDTPFYIRSLRFTTDIDKPCVFAQVRLNHPAADGRVTLRTFFDGRPTGQDSVPVRNGVALLSVALSERHLWELGHGALYDAQVVYEHDGKTDIVSSYFGLRSLSLDGHSLLINDRPVYQRLVLDQGFFPDGVWTAPDDGAFEKDIRLAMAMGFNGARLHQKVFEPRYLYEADRLGYLVWGEAPSWGLDVTDGDALEAFAADWAEVIERDASHPSIVTWVLHNESPAHQNREALCALVNSVRALDPTRPIIDASGWTHVQTDIYDIHDYNQDGAALAETYCAAAENAAVLSPLAAGKPLILSEYGGTRLEKDSGWGYGDAACDEQALLERISSLTRAVLDCGVFSGFCYTQLTDVEQEQNGLLTFQREPKLPLKALRAVFAAKEHGTAPKSETESV